MANMLIIDKYHSSRQKANLQVYLILVKIIVTHYSILFCNQLQVAS